MFRPLPTLSLTLLLLAACAQPAPQAPVAAPATSSVHFVDLGKGKVQTPASVVLKLQMPQSGAFSTKASSGGVAKSETDISDLQVFLYEMSSGSAPAAGTCPGAAVDVAGASGVTLKHVQLIPVNLSGGPSTFTQTVIFQNIPPNSVGGAKYFIGVRALEGSNNITTCLDGFKQDAGTHDGISVSAGGPIGLAASGNEVTSSFSVSPTTPQSVSIRLLPVSGASLDATISVQPGSTTLPAIDAQ